MRFAPCLPFIFILYSSALTKYSVVINIRPKELHTNRIMRANTAFLLQLFLVLSYLAEELILECQFLNFKRSCHRRLRKRISEYCMLPRCFKWGCSLHLTNDCKLVALGKNSPQNYRAWWQNIWGKHHGTFFVLFLLQLLFGYGQIWDIRLDKAGIIPMFFWFLQS